MLRRLRFVPLAFVAPALLAAQASDPGASPTTHRAARLFRSLEPVAMTLESDFKTVFKDRDSLSTKTYPGKLKFVNEKGDTVALDVTLSTRGHFRLRTCEFLPLKVAFDKEQTKGTPFAGEGSLKLGTHCRNADRFVQNTYVEYAANRMYNLLTPLSLKVRLARMTWVDPRNPKFTVTQPAIWFQDQDDLVKEFGGKITMSPGLTGADMEPRQMALNDVFQYFIGNTDWSVWALHNYRIMAADSAPTKMTAIAYDFDWSGLVNMPYATPDPKLQERYRVTRVTDRLYRSVSCYPPEVLGGVLDLFKTRKDSLLGTLREIKELSPGRLKEAEDFLGKFYKEIEDPKNGRRTFEEPCKKS
jgi:hypothetical protein